ncbi:hypothetical protein M426DRAFT_8993 [Hypoxylon sp. CI-4A]|nr:hypothetical protein M426DRAFT_8993 [Hypoxylon sp. CI-4A]
MVGVAGRNEAKPQCHRCLKAGFECLGYERVTQWRHTSVNPIAPSRFQMPEFMKLTQPVPMNFTPVPELSLVAFEGDMCTAHMFGNFIWKSYGAIWLDQAAQGRLGNLSLDAVKALARLNFGLSNKVQDLQLKGAAQYGNCLRVLAEALDREGSLVHGDRTLVVPILILMMVSAIQADRSGAFCHLKAIGKVLMLCGPEAFQQQPLRNAYEAARATLLVASLFSRRRTFLEHPYWQEVPYALDPCTKPQQSYLLDVLVTIPGFLEENNHIDDMTWTEDNVFDPSLISDDILDHRTVLCERVAAQLERLYRWRWDWQLKHGQYVAEIKHEWQSNTPSPRSTESINSPMGFGRLQFDRAVCADDISLYNAVLMWLMALIWKLQPIQAPYIIRECSRRSSMSPTSSPKSPAFSTQRISFEPLYRPGATLSIRDPAMEICRVFDWQCRHREQQVSFDDQSCMYLFPLGMARSILDADPDCQKWIDSMVDSNPITSGYGKGGGSVVGFKSYITKRALDPEGHDLDNTAIETWYTG